MRLLVTGGAGYIGSVVTGHLLDAGHRVTVVDDLSTGHADAVPAGAEFVRADLRGVGRLLAERPGFDGVLHFAARSLVAESVAHPERYWHANVVGTLSLLDALRAGAVPRLVFSSSAAVYGDPEEVPIAESAPTRPTNPYGASKLAVDLMIGSEARAHGLGAVSLRYFNVAGAVRCRGGWLGERHATETHLIPLALRAATGRGDPLPVYGRDYPTPDGTCVRDFVHVDDLARAHLLALGAAEPGEHRIFNLGNGAGFSVLDVVEAVRTVTGRPVPVTDAARRPGDPAVLVASAERIRDQIGWIPDRTGLDEMVADAWRFQTQWSR
ncbi:MAG TPA: UDP-glucose 4-epimerase GalE [Mycobacteriales bacterium]|nr:UDP-glucose 4-epimerase GalE [Mycobacteriales bacterium]